MKDRDMLKSVCETFVNLNELVDITPYGDGHINATYRVQLRSDSGAYSLILQKINHTIFSQVPELMANIQGVTEYLKKMPLQEGSEVLELHYTLNGNPYYKHSDGTYWRAYKFIEDATGYTFTEDLSKLYEAGKAFGYFQVLLREYPVEQLSETIPNFHNTPHRFKRFQEILQQDPMGRAESCREQIDFVLQREQSMNFITDGICSGEVPLRVTHNDTKLNNVLIDNRSGRARAVIDLDTVMPGSALYDFGDAIRSCGSTVAEDEEDLSKLSLDIPRFQAFTQGFLEQLGPYLTDREIQLFPYGAITMTLECGMRFLTDYLEGDIYFRTHKKNHNLIRAKNQFAFVLEMEKNFSQMEAIVKNYIS